jgi:hypothetical protein
MPFGRKNDKIGIVVKIRPLLADEWVGAMVV